MTSEIVVEDRRLPKSLDGMPKGMLISGRWVPAQSGNTFESVNPSTGQKLATVAAGDRADVDAAVAAAQRAFKDRAWSRMNPHERTRVLLRLADAIEAHAAELAELETLDNGMPYAFSSHSANDQATVFRYYAGWPTKLFGTTNPADDDALSYTIRQPVGVCAGIIPWNTALSMAVWKIAPALACGNTVVIKPAEDASLAVLRLGEILTEAGLPDGVLNIVTGFGETAGAAIASHPGIAKVAFTGSTAVGKKIVEASAGNLKRVTLELGGKSPHIVFDDADIDTAAANAAAGFCTLSGQACVSGTRLFVQEGVYDRFVDALTKRVEAIKVGDPFAAGTTMGPLASAAQFEKVTSYLSLGNESGGTARTGGKAFPGPGYFVPPTIFEGVTNDMRIVREEIFGPVAAVMPFSSESDVIQQANDTTYGLAAAIATKDLSRAHRLARELDAGVVWVNTYNELDPIFPFGGFKQSGLGREFGEQSLDNFTELKSVFIRL
jgi:acyl-CoA reductase-like NAD-dependent aldehyde dehydrogenase